MTPPVRPSSNSLARIVWEFAQFAKPYRSSIALATSFVLLRVGVEMLRPWPLKIVIDHVLKDQPLDLPLLPFISRLDRGDLLTLSCVLMLALTVAYGGFAYLASSRISSIGQHITYDIRKKLFRHVQRLPLSFYDRGRTGDMVTRLHSDISNVQDLLISFVNVFLVNGLTIFGILLMMTQVDWRFTLIALTVSPLLFLITRHYTLRIKTAQRGTKSKEGEIASLVQENVSLIRTVQAFGCEEREAERFDNHAIEARDVALRATEMQSRLEPWIEIATTVGTVLIVGYGAREVLLGRMSLGTMIVLLTYLQSLYSPIRQLAKLVNVTSKATVSAERVHEILRIESDLQDAPDAAHAPKFQGRIRFENVAFAYPRRIGSKHSSEVLSDIDLEIEPGMTVAIVGPTGSGKTSLVSLLPRLYAPSRGKIRIDGMDIANLKLASLRGQIGFVLQEAALFRTSIWENIAYGAYGTQSTMTHDRIVQAAVDANAHEFISRMPEGYFTHLSERGATLSGGQRQRISIARAIVRDAPILILDEPTTGLDAVSEKQVLEALDRLKRGRTTLVIAHRLNTVRQADRILVLNQGRIAEAGTHDELYSRAELYRRFCDLQLDRCD